MGEAERLSIALVKQRGVMVDLQEQIHGLEGKLEKATQQDRQLAESCHILKVAMLALLAQEIEAMRSNNSA